MDMFVAQRIGHLRIYQGSIEAAISSEANGEEKSLL